MKKILTTRARAIILTIFITLLFAVSAEINFLEILKIELPFDFIRLLVLSFVYYLGLFWVLNFRVKGERFITILLFPSLSLFIITLYVELIINSVLDSVDRLFIRFLASVVITVVVYILTLTVNILNVGFIEKIPLSQAGRASHYVLTLIINYLFLSLLFSNSLYIYIKFFLLFVFVYLFTSISLWTIDLRFKHRVLSSLAISISMLIFSLVLSIWPISSEYMSLILSLIYYMTLGLALEVREVLNVKVWFEYTFLYAGIIVILFLIAEWGINGQLL